MAELQLPPEARPHGRERWKKRLAILAVVFLALIALGILIQATQLQISPWPEEYEEVMAPPKPGFYTGYCAGDVWVFLFYEHPQYGLRPLRGGDLVPTDELIFYFLAFEDTKAEIRLEEYMPELRGNVTVKLENRTYRDMVHCLGRHITGPVRVQLDSAATMKTLDVYVNGQMVVRLRHKTFPAFLTAGYYTLGSLEMDRAGFVVLTALVCAIAMGFSRATIGKIKYVPDIPRWAVILLFCIILGIAGLAWWLIRYYALIRAAHLSIPIGFFIYIYGLYLMRSRPNEFYFSKMYVGGGTPRKDILMFQVTAKRSEGEFELAPESWREVLKAILLGRRKILELRTPDGFTPLWCIDLGGGDREYIFQDIEEVDGRIVVTVAGLHALDVERWTYELIGVQDLARDKEQLRRQLHELRATMELEIDKRTQENIRHYWELRRRCFLGRRGPQPPMITAGREVGEAQGAPGREASRPEEGEEHE